MYIAQEEKQLHTAFACVFIGRALRERESERANNLSVLIVKPPNLKFKLVCNYTPALHVFSLAAPSVSVRAREQTI